MKTLCNLALEVSTVLIFISLAKSVNCQNGTTSTSSTGSTTTRPPTTTTTPLPVLKTNYVSVDGREIRFIEGDSSNLYGENLILRSSPAYSAYYASVDAGHPLPDGVLTHFYGYLHNSTDARGTIYRLRLQIWRAIDTRTVQLQLVYQQAVEMIVYTGAGTLYTFKLEKEFQVKYNDMIGWTTTNGPIVPISREFSNTAQIYQYYVGNGIPELGRNYTFGLSFSNQAHSIAVKVEPRTL